MPPDGGGSLLDALPGGDLLQRRLVVNHVERPEAHFADVVGLELVLRTALSAFQPQELGHLVSLEWELRRQGSTRKSWLSGTRRLATKPHISRRSGCMSRPSQIPPRPRTQSTTPPSS